MRKKKFANVHVISEFFFLLMTRIISNISTVELFCEARTFNFLEHPAKVVYIFGKLRLWLFQICVLSVRSLRG